MPTALLAEREHPTHTCQHLRIHQDDNIHNYLKESPVDHILGSHGTKPPSLPCPLIPSQPTSRVLCAKPSAHRMEQSLAIRAWKAVGDKLVKGDVVIGKCMQDFTPKLVCAAPLF